MGIPYDGTQPNANTRPAVSQPTMQSNFASIKTLIDIDHVDFGNAKYGMHDQVTFAANNVPAVPTSPPVLFTNGSPGALYFYSGSAAQSANQYYTNVNFGVPTACVQSSALLLGGFIIKFGVITFNNAVSTGTTFNAPFPTAGLNIQLSLMNSNGTPPTVTPRIFTFNASGFTFGANTTGASSLYWTAIGN